MAGSGNPLLREARNTVRVFSGLIPGRRTLLGPHTLTDAVGGRNVLITGASAGIGRAAALMLGVAGANVLLVARSVDPLAEVRDEIVEGGGSAHVHGCDLAEQTDIDRMMDELLAAHGHVDVLVNNAGRSIRRAIALSYDRMHDFERTMSVNYFGAVKLILRVMPGMRERHHGQIVNVSTMGVQTNVPRFGAYLASKAALDALSRSIASEIAHDGIAITTVHMPLVRTAMIEPTALYRHMPAISPEDAAGLIAEAIIKRPKTVGPRSGDLAQLTYAIAPRAQDAVLNAVYRAIPERRER